MPDYADLSPRPRSGNGRRRRRVDTEAVSFFDQLCETTYPESPMKSLLPTVLVAVFAVAATSTFSSAAEYEVRMLNKDSSGQMWQFEPAFLKIAPGDTVTFISTDKGHNTEAIAAAVPQGTEPWKGKMNTPVQVTYTQEGIYVYKCLPHAALGMVGIIQVGENVSNLEAATKTKIPGKGKARMAELIQLIGK